MAIVWTPHPLQPSKATNAIVIKNPDEVKNAFTIKDEPKASATLKLGTQNEIKELKSFLKDYDMTSISTDDLKKIGSRLFRSGVIDSDAFSMFMNGNMASDEKGFPTNTHVKFNAIALFNQRLEDYTDYLAKHPKLATHDNLAWRQGMLVANQAISALAYFANSPHTDLSIDEKA